LDCQQTHLRRQSQAQAQAHAHAHAHAHAQINVEITSEDSFQPFKKAFQRHAEKAF
jgi:hypothetical protein